MAVLARVDHAAAAHGADLPLRPTEVIIFGNARAGTPLMQLAQPIGLDLPLKILVWQDAVGETHLTYEDPIALADRHSLPTDAAPVIENMRAALDAVTREATKETRPL